MTTKFTPPPLPAKPMAVFHHPLGIPLYDGTSMDMHAMRYAMTMLAQRDMLLESLQEAEAGLEVAMSRLEATHPKDYPFKVTSEYLALVIIRAAIAKAVQS